MTEFDEERRREILREDNKRTAKVIDTILEGTGDVSIRQGLGRSYCFKLDIPTSPTVTLARLDHDIGSDLDLDELLGCIIDDNLVPEGINFPAYYIYIDSRSLGDETLRVTSPFGLQPHLAVDPSGIVWHFENVFIFDRTGNGFTFQGVLSSKDGPEFIVGEQDAPQIPRIDFFPDNYNFRSVPEITFGEREMISGWLGMIRNQLLRG